MSTGGPVLQNFFMFEKSCIAYFLRDLKFCSQS